MALKTYYWNTRKVSAVNFYISKLLTPKRKVFRYGNAGDIFNIDLIKYLYNQHPVNTTKEGRRLLMVGSIASVIEESDVICGIGWKGEDLTNKASQISAANVCGVRGPLTKSLFEKYEADLSHLKFELDPGLLIKEVYNLDVNEGTNENVIFIPHYRDHGVYNGKYPDGIKVINIDNVPKVIAKEILKAKVIYSSSLHGIIFSHALNKECVFVKPQSDEPLFKYYDYFLSIGMEAPEPIKNIHALEFCKDRPTALNKAIGLNDFEFPTLGYLRNNGIIN